MYIQYVLKPKGREVVSLTQDWWVMRVKPYICVCLNQDLWLLLDIPIADSCIWDVMSSLLPCSFVTLTATS